MVECDLAKVEVAGSNPVSRSIVPLRLPLAQARVYALWAIAGRALGQCKARYPSGKGEVCKTFMRRFDSDPRLQSFNHLQAQAKNFSADWLALVKPASFNFADRAESFARPLKFAFTPGPRQLPKWLSLKQLS